MNFKVLSLIACAILTAGLASCGGDEGNKGPSPAADTKTETPAAGSNASPAGSNVSPAASPSPAATTSPAAKKASPAPTKTP